MYKRIIILLFVVLYLFAGTVFAQSREGDSLALVDLYNSTNGDGWTNSTNWLSGSIDAWYGVTVSGGRVTWLDLSNNQLAGSIPSSIGNLTGLTYVYLNNNQLTGSIPASIGNLTNLFTVYLRNNLLNGSIPSEIGDMSTLQSLQLQYNQLTGSIPSEIGDLSDLRYLQLQENQLTSSIPASIGNCTDLISATFQNNQLTGSVPSEIVSLTNLQYLYLHENDLTGLPSLSALSSLLNLRIQDNKFTFEDIEPNVGVASDEFIYSPQDSVGNSQDRTVTVGSNLTISVSVGGTSNEYQWKKDGSNISGANSDSYTITSAEMSDAGSYTCEITNTVATELTLYARPITVTVNPVSPKITVISPNGGEYWEADSTYNITWTSNGTSGNVHIEYSIDNGANWTDVTESIPDTGSYFWTIPDTPSDSCMVRISDTDGSPSDVSNSIFTISNTSYITVTSPNGGEDWKVDSTYDITWTSNGASDSVKIEYSTDNGSNWIELIASMPDTGIYSWTIPDSASDSCLIRVSDTDDNPTDVSDSVFSISSSSAVPEDKLPEIYSMSVRNLAVSNKFEVRYSIPENASVKLGVYNINGTKIKEISGQKVPGIYKEVIDLKGSPAGAYFIEMKANGKKVAETEKVVLVR